MNCKLTNASAQQRDRQTFRGSLRLINQVRGENLLTTHRLSALYFSTNRRHCASRLPPFQGPRLFSGRPVTFDTPLILLILSRCLLLVLRQHCQAFLRHQVQ